MTKRMIRDITPKKEQKIEIYNCTATQQRFKNAVVIKSDDNDSEYCFVAGVYYIR